MRIIAFLGLEWNCGHKADELRRFHELENTHHYMGKTHSGGETMRLVVEEDGGFNPAHMSAAILV